MELMWRCYYGGTSPIGWLQDASKVGPSDIPLCWRDASELDRSLSPAGFGYKSNRLCGTAAAN